MHLFTKWTTSWCKRSTTETPYEDPESRAVCVKLLKELNSEVMQMRNNIFAAAFVVFRECEVLLICVKNAQILELLQRFLFE